MMPIVALTFDLWTPKSIELILSPWLPCLPSLMNKCPLWLWPVTSKINRVYSGPSPWITCMPSLKKHNGLVSIVFPSLFLYMSIVTSDHKNQWGPSSPYGYHVCQVWWRSTQWFSLYLVHKLKNAYFHLCQLWPWPLTSKINRVHPLVIVNMYAKFDE